MPENGKSELNLYLLYRQLQINQGVCETFVTRREKSHSSWERTSLVFYLIFSSPDELIVLFCTESYLNLKPKGMCMNSFSILQLKRKKDIRFISQSCIYAMLYYFEILP